MRKKGISKGFVRKKSAVFIGIRFVEVRLKNALFT